MKRHLLCVVLVLLLSSVRMTMAAPSKGYLNAEEIKGLLDQFPDGVSLAYVEAILGPPTIDTDNNLSWHFDEYNVYIDFVRNRIGNTLSNMHIDQRFYSYSERGRISSLHQEFNTVMGSKPVSQNNAMTIWQGRDGYYYAIWTDSPNSIWIFRKHIDDIKK